MIKPQNTGMFHSEKSFQQRKNKNEKSKIGCEITSPAEENDRIDYATEKMNEFRDNAFALHNLLLESIVSQALQMLV